MSQPTAVLNPRQWQFLTEVAELGAAESLVVMPGSRLWCWRKEPWKLLPRSYRWPPLEAGLAIRQAAFRLAIVKVIDGREHLGCVIRDVRVPAVRAVLEALRVPVIEWSEIESGSVTAGQALEKARYFLQLGMSLPFQPHPEEEALRTELEGSFALTWPWHLQGVPLPPEVEHIIDEHIAARRRKMSIFRGVALQYFVPASAATTPEEENHRLLTDVDFLVHGRGPAINLPLMAIEYDGRIHEDVRQREKDVMKDRLCAAVGVPILRINTRNTSVRDLGKVGTEPYERLEIPISRILAIAERFCEAKVSRLNRDARTAKAQSAVLDSVMKTVEFAAPGGLDKGWQLVSNAMVDFDAIAEQDEISEHYFETLDSQLPQSDVQYEVGEIGFKSHGAAEYAEVLLSIEGQKTRWIGTPSLHLSFPGADAAEARRFLRAVWAPVRTC